MTQNYYADGEWEFLCDLCGKLGKSSDARKTWNGYYVCSHHKEERNPQDFLRGIKDNQHLPWTRPEPPDTFLLHCTLPGRTALVEFAVVDCVVVELIPAAFDPEAFPPPCIPITITADTVQTGAETWWACGQALIEADLTLMGTLGVY